MMTNFRFKILQPSGGSSKSLSLPVRSTSFKWTASSVAGKNARVPMYILAQDDLKVLKIVINFVNNNYFS